MMEPDHVDSCMAKQRPYRFSVQWFGNRKGICPAKSSAPTIPKIYFSDIQPPEKMAVYPKDQNDYII